MNFKRKIASSLVLSLGITSVLATPMFAESISDLQDEQASIKNSIEQKQNELNSNSSQKSETVEKIKEISDSINATQQKIASYSTQISDRKVLLLKQMRRLAKLKQS